MAGYLGDVQKAGAPPQASLTRTSAVSVQSEHRMGLRLETDPVAALQSRMLPVLDLDPVPELAAAVSALTVLGNHTLPIPSGSMPEQVWTDLALFEVREEDAVDAARQQPRQACLAHRQRQFAEILAVAHQNVEGVEPHLGIMPARVQAVEVRAAIDAQQHGFAIKDERTVAVARAASDIGGKPIAPVMTVAGP